SILQFGIIDFVGLSTANPMERDKICRSIEQSIHAHEPRLKQVKVEMLMDEHNRGSLCVSIHAFLNIYLLYEPVIFDAFLKATTQQYVILAKTSAGVLWSKNYYLITKSNYRNLGNNHESLPINTQKLPNAFR